MPPTNDTAPAPRRLGRGAVVEPGREPPRWLADAPRFVVEHAVLADPKPTADRLHRMWAAREPFVVELAVPADELKAPEKTDEAAWALGAAFEFPRERLCHLVWANNYDCRRGGLKWWHAVVAARACGPVTEGGPADALDGGEPVWIDGGPRQPLSLPPAAPQAVVHRESSETGRTTRLKHSGPRAGLAPDQLAAVAAATSAVRVVAPAGSGKTRVLTERLRHLLSDRGYEPDMVTALAYNNAAAAELRARCGGFAPHTATVHSFCLDLVRRHRRTEVVDERQVRDILGRLVERPREANTDPYAPYIDALALVRTGLADPRDVEARTDDVEGLTALVPAYREELARRRAVDFPEMIVLAVEILLRDPAARKEAQARCRHLLVDEFQDLAPAYVLLIRLLSAPSLQVYGVGDPDQVVYRHAGADPRFLVDYGDYFPGAADHPLGVNYRCPPQVVEGVVRLLSHNEVRVEHTITAATGRETERGSVKVKEYKPGTDASAAAEVVTAWLDAGTSHDDVAVLARVNASLLPVQVEMALAKIPCRSPLGLETMNRTGVRAALAYLRLATDPRGANGADVAEVLYRPYRPLPGSLRATLRGTTFSMKELQGLRFGLNGRAREAWNDLCNDIGDLRRAAPAPNAGTGLLLDMVRFSVGVEEAAEKLDGSAGNQPSKSHADDLAALTAVAHHCPDPHEFEPFLREVLSWSGDEGVRLSSVHRVKGLEWDKVLVVGAEQGLWPHRLCLTAEEVEEERRIFHVAVTRCRENVTVLVPEGAASPFVTEFHPAHPAAAPRARVPGGAAAGPDQNRRP